MTNFILGFLAASVLHAVFFGLWMGAAVRWPPDPDPATGGSGGRENQDPVMGGSGSSPPK